MIEVLTSLSAQIQLIHFINDLHNFTGKEVQDKKQLMKKKKKEDHLQWIENASDETSARMTKMLRSRNCVFFFNIPSPQEFADEVFDPFLRYKNKCVTVFTYNLQRHAPGMQNYL